MWPYVLTGKNFTKRLLKKRANYAKWYWVSTDADMNIKNITRHYMEAMRHTVQTTKDEWVVEDFDKTWFSGGRNG